MNASGSRCRLTSLSIALAQTYAMPHWVAPDDAAPDVRATWDTYLDRLWAHCTDPKLAYAHKWKQGDILVWDNRSVIHRREAFDPNARRIMLRTQIQGETPVAARAA